MTSRLALAAPSALAAAAADHVARRNGNAVDAAVAAAMVAINTEPGVCALAGGAFVTAWPADELPLTYDGNVTVPGRNGTRPANDGAVAEVALDYGGGVTTLVGAGAVATPGTLAALHAVWRDHGRLDWHEVMVPAVAAARDGFPLSSACRHYLEYSGDSIFGRASDSRKALHDDSGALIPTGGRIVVPHLADSLALIARHGPDVFYRGELADRIVSAVQADGGTLTMDDLATYEVVRRSALTLNLGNWQLATNPPPAIGGAMLAATLAELTTHGIRDWDSAGTSALIDALEAVLGYRRDVLDLSRDLGNDTRRLLERTGLGAGESSGATVHVSAVDDNGLACAVTASSGYGSGDMPPGTGLWLNNCLGEIDLNRHGLDAGSAGTRLMSNMAPSCARRGRDALSIGSPGASRITTALVQTLLPALCGNASFRAAIAAPRLHVEYTADGFQLAAERGVTGIGHRDVRWYDEPSMYFGGVGAAWCVDDALDAAADPRRTGAVHLPAAEN
ncbi:MAG: gamma-glutamyltransferase [Pseudomonadota bacterium]